MPTAELAVPPAAAVASATPDTTISTTATAPKRTTSLAAAELTIVPPRPYSEWVIYFQLERHYIVQKILRKEPDYSSTFDPGDPVQQYPGPPLPGRYDGTLFPKKFYTSFKDAREKKKRHDQNILSLQDLSNMVKNNWETADDETKEYVRVMHRLEIEEYTYRRSVYDRALETKQGAAGTKKPIVKKSEEQKVEEEAKKEEDGSGSKKSDDVAKTNDIHESHQPIMEQRMDPSEAATKKRASDSDGDEEVVPSNKHPKLSQSPASTADHQQNFNFHRLLQNENITLATLQQTNPALLGQFSNIGAATMMTNPMAYQACMSMAAASSGGHTNPMLTRAAPFMNNAKCQAHYEAPLVPSVAGIMRDNNSGTTGRDNVSSGASSCPKGGPRTFVYPPPPPDAVNSAYSNSANFGEVALSRCGSWQSNAQQLPPSQFSAAGGSFAAAGRDIIDCSAGSTSSRSSLYSRNELGPIVPRGGPKPDQQGGGTDDGIKRIQDENSLSDKEIRMLLLRGAKSIAHDAARSLENGRAHTCPAETKAAIKYLEGIKKASSRVSGNSGSGGLTEDKGQNGKLSVEEKTNIATVAAAATAAGLRLLPPSNKAEDGRSEDEARDGQNHRACPSKPTRSEDLSLTSSSHGHMTLQSSSIQSESNQGGESVPHHLQQSVLNREIVKNQQPRAMMGNWQSQSMPRNMLHDGNRDGSPRTGPSINNVMLNPAIPATAATSSTIEHAIESESQRVKGEADEFLRMLLSANIDKLRAIKSLLQN